MTQYEMTEQLSEKLHVTLEDAKTALENGDWNMLTATHLLEQEKFRRMQELNEAASTAEAAAVQFAPDEGAADAISMDDAATEEAAAEEKVEETGNARARKHRGGKALRNLGQHIRRLVACGNRNRLEVRKGDELVLSLPVTVVAVAMLCAFWVCLILLVVGLFTGCHYSFNGKELGRKNINDALAKAADAAEQMKQNVAKA